MGVEMGWHRGEGVDGGGPDHPHRAETLIATQSAITAETLMAVTIFFSCTVHDVRVSLTLLYMRLTYCKAKNISLRRG